MHLTFTASVSRGRLGCSQISHPTKQTQRSRQMGRSFILHQLHHNGLVEDATGSQHIPRSFDFGYRPSSTDLLVDFPLAFDETAGIGIPTERS